jgi:cytochrome d ubiquinol oxidase subunit I
MVGSGTALLLIAAGWAIAALRRRPVSRALMGAVALGAPLGLIALEAGWFVTEFGRQPWIARGLLRTADAVTTSPDLDARFFVFSLIYVVLAATCWWLLRRVGRPEVTS